jgi:hypothetical protein
MLKIKQLFSKVPYVVSALALTVIPILGSTVPAGAVSQLTPRKVTISNSASAATNVTYTFNFTVASATAIQSVSFQFCDAASGTCTTPGSFAAGSAALASQPINLGAASGWTVSNSTNSIRILDAANVTAPSGAQTVVFNTVTNPTLANSTFFIRIATFSGSNWSTGPLDAGVVAASTAGQITVTASVDEALTFTLSAATVALGTLTTGTTGKDGTTTMVASTNASTGYSVTYSGTSLTSPGGALPSYASSASAAGTAGFGFNLMANTTPSVGAGVSGGGSGTAFTGYGTANAFTFNSGDKIASASAPTNSNTFTLSYVANVGGATPAGAYTTTLNYVATSNF